MRGLLRRLRRAAPPPAPDGRLRVVTLIDYLDGGGAERVAMVLSQQLDRERFDVTVCVTRERRRREVEMLEDSGVPVVCLRRSDRLRLGEWRPLWRLMRSGEVDVLHAHLHGSNLWASVLGRLAGVPVVIATEHTWSFEGQWLRRVLDRNIVGRLATAFVAVSEFDRRRMVDLIGVPAEKTRVISTGLIPHEGEDAARRSDVRGEVGLTAEETVIGTVAWLRPQKALHVLIEAFARIAARHPRAHLVIAGDGDERARLEGYARRLGVPSRVHFLGLRRDVANVLAAMDVVAISSDFEGSPLFLFEAMEAERPVVSTSVGAVAEILDHGRCGILVPARDSEAMGEALAELIDDPDRARELARRARERVDERYGFDTITREWADLYVELYERETTAAPA